MTCDAKGVNRCPLTTNTAARPLNHEGPQELVCATCLKFEGHKEAGVLVAASFKQVHTCRQNETESLDVFYKRFRLRREMLD